MKRGWALALIIAGGLFFLLGVYYFAYYPVALRNSQKVSVASEESTPTVEPTYRTVAEMQRDIRRYIPPVPARPVSQLSYFADALRIEIPSIGLRAEVVESRDADDVSKAWKVIHDSATSNPGMKGKTFMWGHMNSFKEGSIFNHLDEVKVNDPILLHTDDNWYLYVVNNITPPLKPEKVNFDELLKPVNDYLLILMTCLPDYYYTHRLLITARLYPSWLIDTPTDYIISPEIIQTYKKQPQRY